MGIKIKKINTEEGYIPIIPVFTVDGVEYGPDEVCVGHDELATHPAFLGNFDVVPDEGGESPEERQGKRNADREAIIRNAILSMDPNDEDQFTDSGYPNARVITGLVGFVVTGAERTKIWNEIKAEQKSE